MITNLNESANYDTKLIAKWLKAKFDDEAFGTAKTMHGTSDAERYMNRNNLVYNSATKIVGVYQGSDWRNPTPIYKVIPQYGSKKVQGTYAPKLPKIIPIDEYNSMYGESYVKESSHTDLVNKIYSVMANYEYGYDPDMSDINAMLQELVINNGIDDIKSNAFKKAWISAHNKAERKVWGRSGDAMKYDDLTPGEQDAIDNFDEDYWKRWRKHSKTESKRLVKESFDDDWTVSTTSQFYDGRKQTLRKFTRELDGHKILVCPKYNEKFDQIDWTVFLDGEKKEVFETSYDAIDFVDYELADLYL